ncbi:maleylpyruvate isomerase family mycothiol-dependent enzyme [Blastococcus sp. CCUG 61487]|uniref:maleylpyruvate isomerase family mycothiol-dependent enzyme n=1 Tax=Blastococcus sp. CCUG 61487 TaxID=1840703 RepID=UPI0010BF73D0|nr:maleylpyruvate isomerase family mycothiol-dependent enzyme [Blastococcus sp. CCUG 61487]TKJ16827.1 hypothetical protein A6V29_13060 [Blastococcus sp. CCUG 61487]
MPVDAVWATIDRERLDLADLLADLARAEWEHPSLAEGWRVRDVAAHLALAHTGAGRAALDLIRAGGRMPRMIHDAAVRHAELPPERLVEQIRAMAGSRRKVPGLSPLEPLLDVLVHGQDIAVPLGRPRAMPVDAAAAAATRVWTMRWPMSATFPRVAGVRLVACDTDWAVGDGELVEGPVQALLMVLTGRTAAVRDQLAGPGAARLA